MNICEQLDAKRPSPPNIPDILWVDDDIDYSEFLICLGFPDLKLTFARSGFEALYLLNKNHYSMVVTDLVHPGPSGYELLEFLRLKQPSVPVVVVAGFEQASREFELAKSLGAVVCLPKCFTGFANVIPSTIAKLARSQKPPQGLSHSKVVESLLVSPFHFGVVQLGSGAMSLERAAIQSVLGGDVNFFRSCDDLLLALDATSDPVVLLANYPEDVRFHRLCWEIYMPGYLYSGDKEQQASLRSENGRHQYTSAHDFVGWLATRYSNIRVHLHTGELASDLPDIAVPANDRIILHRLDRREHYDNALAALAKKMFSANIAG